MRGFPWSYLGRGRGNGRSTRELLVHESFFYLTARRWKKSPGQQAQVQVQEEGRQSETKKHDNQLDQNRNHKIDFKHRGPSGTKKHENHLEHSRNQEIDFKRKGTTLEWMRATRMSQP